MCTSVSQYYRGLGFHEADTTSNNYNHFRRSNYQPRGGGYNIGKFRNQRSYDARPICDFCRKKGHTMNNCYSRQRTFDWGPYGPNIYGANIYGARYNPEYGMGQPNPALTHVFYSDYLSRVTMGTIWVNHMGNQIRDNKTSFNLK